MNGQNLSTTKSNSANVSKPSCSFQFLKKLNRKGTKESTKNAKEKISIHYQIKLC